MQNVPHLNQNQRREFEQTLTEKLREASSVLSAKVGEAQPIALQRLIEKKEISDLVTTAKTLRDQLDVIEKELEFHGFDFSKDGAVRLRYDIPQELDDEYEALIEEQVAGERQKVEQVRRALENSWQIVSFPVK